MEVSGRPNGVSFSETNDWEKDEKILLPYTYFLKTPSMGIRATLIKAFNYWLNVPAEKLALLQELFQMYHIGAVLFDDIQDNSALRRGVPAAHTVYGVASTISAAVCAHLISLQKARSSNYPDMIKLYTEVMLELWRGQEMEIYWRENHTCPSEEEYMEMVNKKTGAVITLGVQMMQLFSENKADFTKLTGAFGRYFQIRDDYCSLCLHEFSEKKGYCEDIREGKFIFPVVHAIKSRPNDNQVLSILRQRTGDVELKKYCVKLLEDFGSMRYAKQTLEDLDAELRAEVSKLGGNPMLEDLLDKALDWKMDTDEKHTEK